MKRIISLIIAVIIVIGALLFVGVYPRGQQMPPSVPLPATSSIVEAKPSSTPALPTPTPVATSSLDVPAATTPATPTPIEKPVPIPPPKPKPPAPKPTPPPPVQAPACNTDTWKCTSWGACQPDNLQSRTCSMTVDCPNTETSPPSIRQVCAYQA
ncbi:MAG: hypothetical protein AAB932_02565, partial [Patescibacteria group bacterium]